MLQAGGQGEAYAPLDFGRPEGAAGQRQRAALLLISFEILKQNKRSCWDYLAQSNYSNVPNKHGV